LRRRRIVLDGFGRDALARRNNPPSGATGSIASGGNTCAACHTGVTAWVRCGFSALREGISLAPHYNLTVRISDAAQVGAGFELSVEDAAGTHVGTLIASDAVNTQINTSDANYINHTGRGSRTRLPTGAGWATLRSTISSGRPSRGCRPW